MELFKLDLGPLGAEGFSLRDRADFTGHFKKEHLTLPHVNSEVVLLGGEGEDDRVVQRDLVHNQIPGFNCFTPEPHQFVLDPNKILENLSRPLGE